MNITKTVAASLFASAAAVAMPALAEPPSYTYVEAGGFRLNLDDLDIDPTGYYLAGSARLGESLFVRGFYADGDDDWRFMGNKVNVDVTDLRVGLGFIQEIDNQSSWYVIAEYLEPEVEVDTAFGSANADENGGAISAGIRNNLTRQFELFGELGYFDVDDSDGFIGHVGALYNFVPNFGITAKAEVDEDKNSGLYAGIRYSF